MLRRLAIVFMCGLVSALASSSASVGAVHGLQSRVLLSDGAKDVWEDNPREGTLTLFGEFPTADVRWAVGRHLRGSVIVRMRFVNLQRVGTQQTHAAFIKTPNNLYLALVMSFPNRRAGRHHLEQWGPPAHGSMIRCDGMTHHISYPRDVAQMRVPRSCLGSPRWIRLGMHNVLFTGRSLQAPMYLDNPHNDRADAGQRILTRRLLRR